jgi:ribosomal protein L19
LIPFGSQRWEIPQLNGGFNEEIHLKFEVLMGTKTSIWSFDGEIIELNGACSHV